MLATLENGDAIPSKDRCRMDGSSEQRKPAWCYYDNDLQMVQNTASYITGLQ